MTSAGKVIPYFSLVIPFYNRLLMVKETINSVFEQDFRQFEILVIDDGSNDGSSAMLDALYDGQDQVRIIHQENKERGAARNRGYRESLGTYVIFLDSDDLLLPDHLSTLYRKIQDLGAPEFIATKFEFLVDGRRKSSTVGSFPEGYYNYKLFLDGNPFGCNVCVRRENPDLILFEEDRSLSIKEDWLFFMSNLRRQRMYLVDKVTLLMVEHENRSMRGDNTLLIHKTSLARDWILRNVELSAPERRRLEAHVGYFCAIHSYLEGDRGKSLQFIFRSFGKGGLRRKYIVLLIKIVIGRKTILRLTHGS